MRNAWIGLAHDGVRATGPAPLYAKGPCHAAPPPRSTSYGIHHAWQESFVYRYRLWSARVIGIEVTQAIQYHRTNEHLTDAVHGSADNSVELIEFKDAWGRVYVRPGLLSTFAKGPLET